MRCPSRRTTCIVLASLCVLLILAVVIWWPPSGPINRRNYERIQIGMPLAQVERLMGGPGRDIGPVGWNDVAFDEDRLRSWRAAPSTLRNWYDSNHMITVHIDSNHNVVNKYFQCRPDATWFLRWLAWLGF